MNKNLLALVVVVAVAFACGRTRREVAHRASSPPRDAASRAPTAPATAPAPASTAPIVREVAVVRVGAMPERWQLEWRRPPTPACGADDPDAAGNCACTGFAFGEEGVLDLVRKRPGRLDERLALTPVFGEVGDDGPTGIDSLAVLQHWPGHVDDYFVDDWPKLEREVRARPVTRAMKFGDYDHDGHATEFLLQVGTLPCGRREEVLVGVSAADSTLHVFRSVGHPERALVLQAEIWEKLRRGKETVTTLEWPCRDHGSDTQTELTLRAGPAGIDGTRFEYQCSGLRARRDHVTSKRI